MSRHVVLCPACRDWRSAPRWLNAGARCREAASREMSKFRGSTEFALKQKERIGSWRFWPNLQMLLAPGQRAVVGALCRSPVGGLQKRCSRGRPKREWIYMGGAKTFALGQRLVSGGVEVRGVCAFKACVAGRMPVAKASAPVRQTSSAQLRRGGLGILRTASSSEDRLHRHMANARHLALAWILPPRPRSAGARSRVRGPYTGRQGRHLACM